MWRIFLLCALSSSWGHLSLFLDVTLSLVRPFLDQLELDVDSTVYMQRNKKNMTLCQNLTDLAYGSVVLSLLALNREKTSSTPPIIILEFTGQSHSRREIAWLGCLQENSFALMTRLMIRRLYFKEEPHLLTVSISTPLKQAHETERLSLESRHLDKV